jgi:hypothetical protein
LRRYFLSDAVTPNHDQLRDYFAASSTLEDTKSIAFGIYKIALPARPGNGKFWKGNFPTKA